MPRKPEKKNPADKNAGMTTLATIDVGAHSARLLIAEVDSATREFTPLEELERPVPLGSNVFRSGGIR